MAEIELKGNGKDDDQEERKLSNQSSSEDETKSETKDLKDNQDHYSNLDEAKSYAKDVKDRQDPKFDFDALVGFLEKIDKIKQMNIEELTSLAFEINEHRLLFPRTKEEIHDFEKLVMLWDETINKICKLAQEIVSLRENDEEKTDEERILAQNLSMINRSLVEIDSFLTRFCAVYRYFPLKDQNSLLLIYDSLEKNKSDSLQGILMHNSSPTLLKSSLFPKQLTDISSSEHFTGLLKNAHIQMKIDSKDLTKSTFSIIQGCPGGGLLERITQFLSYVMNSTLIRIHVLVSLGARFFRNLILKVSGNSLISAFGLSCIGGGGAALSIGVPIVGPAIVIAAGIGLFLLGQPQRRTIHIQNELYENTLALDYQTDEALAAAENVRRLREEIQRDRERIRRSQRERAQPVEIIEA